jgi:Histidine kinase
MVSVEESFPALEESPEVPWSLLLLAAGAGWLIVTSTVVLWMQPMSGKVVGSDYYISSPARVLQHLLVFSVSVVAYRVTFWRGTPNYRARPLLFVALQVALALLVVRLAPFASAIAALLVDQRVADFYDSFNSWRPFGPSFRDWLVPMQFFLPPYLLGLALIGVVQLARDFHRESLRSAQLWAAYAEARLTMLSSQLQPHFLFNALHAISELINEDPDRATVMLARLGDFLRHALESSKQPWVTVATEVTGLEAYLAVQQARFRDRLQVDIQVDENAADLTMPSMLLQPLAENAVEHGRGGPASVLAIRVAISLADDRLLIAIRNSTPQLSAPISADRFRNGLKNVTFRLRAAYSGAAELVVGPDPRGGTLATLDVPARRNQ